MSNYTYAPIGELVRIIGGGTPARSRAEYYGGDIPWVTPKDMKLWNVSDSQIRITQLGLDNSAAKVAPENSVLVVVRSGVLKHTLPVAVNRRPVAINQDMKALLCSKALLPDYLARYLQACSETILGWVRATTADNFPVDNLRKLSIPVLPLSAQQRIVDILNEADKLRATRLAALGGLDDLAQSVFIDMFGNPIRNDRSWPWVKVSDFVRGFETGKNIAAGEDDLRDSYRILKVSAVTSGVFDPSESKPAPPSYIPPKSHIVRVGDLLFSRANTSELVGATAFVEPPVSPMLLLPDKLWRFVWHTPPRAEARYINYLFGHSDFREIVSRNATGSSGSMKNISQAKVLAIECGLPPVDLQRKFGERIEGIKALRQSEVECLSELRTLFASLQHQAFSGPL